jgi:hypothetical protein
MANSAPWRTHYLTAKERLEASRDHNFHSYSTLSKILSCSTGLWQLFGNIPAVDPRVLFVQETDGRMKTDLLRHLPPQSLAGVVPAAV